MAELRGSVHGLAQQCRDRRDLLERSLTAAEPDAIDRLVSEDFVLRGHETKSRAEFKTWVKARVQDFQFHVVETFQDGSRVASW